MRIRSGVRVLAAHDQAEGGVGLDDVDGGRERPDARRGAVWCAVSGRGFFVSDDGVRMSVVPRRVHAWISKWVARELSGGQNSKLGKLRLAVYTVWCRYGSIDMGELGSFGKRWTVHVVQRALCPPVLRSSGGQARSEDDWRCSFELPTHPYFVIQ
jgi:hypothetical protein